MVSRNYEKRIIASLHPFQYATNSLVKVQHVMEHTCGIVCVGFPVDLTTLNH